MKKTVMTRTCARLRLRTDVPVVASLLMRSPCAGCTRERSRSVPERRVRDLHSSMEAAAGSRHGRFLGKVGAVA